MLAHALGVIGLGYSDFCVLSPDEFGEVCKSHGERVEEMERQEWERMRLLASITIQPHCKKRIGPEQLLPLPWDRKKRKAGPKSTKERMEEVARRLQPSVEGMSSTPERNQQESNDQDE